MKKPVVYLETSFVSYLTGWVSKDEKVARDQSATRRWWDEEGPKWHAVVSDVVRLETTAGDPEAVARRSAFWSGVESVKATGEADELADMLLRVHALPEKARADAMHVALAAVRGADLLLTWKRGTIAFSSKLSQIYLTLEKAGYKCPAISTPGQMLAAKDPPGEILKEVYRARKRLWTRGGGTIRGVGEYLRECGRRAKERGVLWIESEEEREAIGAEVRARLAKEELKGALCVREEREEYGRAEARRGRGAGEAATKGTKNSKRGKRGQAGGIRSGNHQTVKPSNQQTKKISGRKGAPAQSEVMR